MSQSGVDALKVPGAKLCYEVCGAGPVLLLIPGGPAGAGAFAPIRGVLSNRYTVVTYDPRGLSRSPLHGEAGNVTVQTFADDAHRLLAAIGSGPAFVLGSSGGALVGLELVSRHPEQVRALVAHEPPLTRLLEDADEHARFAREVHGAYLSEGVGPEGGCGGSLSSPAEARNFFIAGPTPEMADAIARMQGNLGFFLGHMLLALGDYAPDISRLRTLPITVAVGEASEGQLAHRAAVAFAGRLGKEPAVFPGDHDGLNSHPRAFARRLDGVLGAYREPTRPSTGPGASASLLREEKASA